MAMPGVFILSGQSVSEGVDTTSRGYQIGYQIGAYLPVAIILFLALLVIWRSYRQGRQNPE
jgi:lipopolysaccharide export LptBFGC system permease protein LptF